MNEIISIPPESIALPARVPVAIRVGTMADLAFMDEQQKRHRKMLGYFPTQQFEDYIEQQAVLIAHEPDAPDTRLGYCISKDRYLKRDELGVVYQLCVVPGVQRKLIGATLIKEMFERSAYGCRLYCCWCAQDIDANRFWESLGFVPIAFRAGSTGKRRVHIFWQKRIDCDDQGTPYWYPFQTNSGAIRQDRLVFPIPAGTHWKDVRAIEVPGMETKRKQISNCKTETAKAKTKKKPGPGAGKAGILVGGRIKYVDRPGATPVPEPEEPVKKVPACPEHRQREKTPAPKIDPKYLKGARELRDRWLEHLHANGGVLSQGKYEVSRALPDLPSPVPLLPAA